MKRLLSNPTVRGLLVLAAASAVIVVLSLEEVLATTAGLLRIAFFLAIAFFLFLVWRERRGDIEAWSEHNRRVFYAAIALAAIDIGAAIGLGPSGIEIVAFLAVLAACAWVGVRVWRSEHHYS
jgi:hypothetical protein